MLRSRITLIDAIVLGVAALATACSPAPQAAITIEALDTADGVSRAEAEALAELLFARFVGCGAQGEFHFTGTHWEVDTHLGYGGEPGPPVLIHAESGVISWGPRCTVYDPHLLFQPDEAEIPCSPPGA